MLLGLLVSFGFFLIYLPLVVSINFFQNDDWVYYKNVLNFISGNFILDPVTAPTFYVQGFLGMMFTHIFGLSRLPVMTLLFSVINFALVYFIVYRLLKKGAFLALFAGLVVFLNPWHGYSMLGFMTDNYFLTFYLLAVSFFLLNETKSSRLYVMLMFFVLFLGFNLRQVSLVFALSLIVYYTLQKKYKLALTSLIFFVANGLYYLVLFPRTAEMFEKGFVIEHLIKFNYAYAIVYGSLLVLTACLLPFVLPNFSNLINKSQRSTLMLFIGLSVGLFFVLNFFFKPQTVSWGEFPYFENTWERTGFFPRNINGTPYYFRGIFDLYRYWDLAAKAVFAIFISYFLFFVRKFKNIFIINTVIYLGVMMVTLTFFDRYLLYLMPTVLFFLLSIEQKYGKFKKILIVGFTIFLAVLNYQFSNEFVQRNNYIWNKANELVNTGTVNSWDILVSTGWVQKEVRPLSSYAYYFSYDKPGLKDNFKCCLELVDTYKIKYPFNLYLDSNIYLYRQK